MKKVLPLALSLLSLNAFSAPARTTDKLLDCNLGFGPVAQVTVQNDGQKLTYSVLSETGRWERSMPLDLNEWSQHRISFDYRNERIEMKSTDNGKSWGYKVFDKDGINPTVIGFADCE